MPLPHPVPFSRDRKWTALVAHLESVALTSRLIRLTVLVTRVQPGRQKMALRKCEGQHLFICLFGRSEWERV